MGRWSATGDDGRVAHAHDVFLSYSSRDKAVVEALASRLRDRGVRVWLDDWEIQPGDSIPSRIESGLEGSAVLVLCMSEHALGSDWAALESQTFRFRDPLNRERRFIPLRLDDAAVRGSLAQFRYIDWRERDDDEFETLVRACQPPAPLDAHSGDDALLRSMSLGNTAGLNTVVCHPDGRRSVTGGDDHTVRVWDLQSGTCERVLEGHTDTVFGVAVDPAGRRAVSASNDQTVRVWDLQSGACERVLEGHTSMVFGVAVDPAGRRAVSASGDQTVRVWDLQSGACERVLEGHTAEVRSAVFLRDAETIVSAATNGVLRIWSLAAGGDDEAPEEHVSYTNAKVVLVGESQAGKSGLALRLAHSRWQHTDSTIGAWATQLKIPASAPAVDGVDREIWLWDFGGQADQRLIHQLYLGDTALAVLVFDGQRDDIIARLWDWNRALSSGRADVPKLLVAGRTDINPVRLSTAQLEQFRTAAGFGEYLQTSASTGAGCDELRDTIIASINWTTIPWHSSPQVFQRLKTEILKLKDTGRALTTTKELRDWLPATIGPFEPDELDAVIGLLAGPGAVMALVGDHVLLQPELINAYAQAVIKTLHDDPEERGCIPEERVLRGELNYPDGFVRLDDGDERVVLHAMHKQLIERPICLRDHDPNAKRPTLLVFPSYYRRERPDRPDQPQSFMTYRFNGYLDEIYATLVVRLHHSQAFDRGELWRNAADLATQTGHPIGLRLHANQDGSGELQLHCAAATAITEQVLFARYVQEHLQTYACDVNRLRTYICTHCATPVENRDAAQRRLRDGKPDIGCSYCDERVELWDDIERQLADPDLHAAVQAIRDATQLVLDSESRERLLVGEVATVVAAANQISREVTVGDHGIDMEIEFKTDTGQATGAKVYLQLKSGDSHLRHRKRDDQRIFKITKPRHADYWADQAFPVMLVIRDAAGTIEWMRIDEHLRRQRETGPWPAHEIAFQGARFDVVEVRKWRNNALGHQP